MTRLFTLTLVISGLALSEGPAEKQLAAYLESHGKSPEDYVAGKFSTHQVVFLGEYHRIRHDVELAQRLIPRLYRAGVKNLGLEFGAEELQAEADSLVAAEAYDPALARSIMFRWSPIWGYHEYIELYRHAWQFNRSLPKGAPKFRIVHLGYRADFSQLSGERTPEVMRKVFHRGDPDGFMAEVIRREFLEKREKALVYCGRHHAFTRFAQ
ncbi:MAG: ChaN family lipoprotein, partial [Acidobacteriota bacterium]